MSTTSKQTKVDPATVVLLARLNAESLSSDPLVLTLWSGEQRVSVYLEEHSCGACVLVVQSAGDPVKAVTYKPSAGLMWYEQRIPPAVWLEEQLEAMRQGTQLAAGTTTPILWEQ